MAEFSLIEQFCQGIGVQHPQTRLSVGDDAAVIHIPDGMELAVSVDSMVAGVHFLADTPAAYLAHKLLAVNVSDMAAMGATAKWATMTLTIPSIDSVWLAEFSQHLNRVANNYDVQLIGGDTTQGPLNLSLQIMGLLPKGAALTRSGAQQGDDVYVSNTVGDAALALQALMQEESALYQPFSQCSSLLRALHQPEPQIALGQALQGIASACIDVSDGVVADLSHIAEQSAVSIKLNVALLPVSPHYQEYIHAGGDLDLALSGGDDYQLAFTAAPEHRQTLQGIASEIGTPITLIGQVIASTDEKVALFQGAERYQLNKVGYQHFHD